MPNITLDIPDTTFACSALPDTNFSSYPLLFAGTDPSYQYCVGLLKINLPSLPVTSVDSAILQLFVIVKTGVSPSPVIVGRATSPFNVDTVTYFTLPTSVATPSQADVMDSDLSTAVQIDVTELVNGWLDGTYANEGIVLKNLDGATAVEFATKAIIYEPFFPKLVLTYSDAPVKPVETPVKPVDAPVKPVDAPANPVEVVNPIYTLPANPVAMEITPELPAEVNRKSGLLSRIIRLFDGFRRKNRK